MNMPFIYLSSYSDQKTVNEAKATQPDAYLVKPFNEKELYTSIEIAVNNYSNRNTASAIQEEKETALIKDSIFIKKDYYYTKVKLSDVLFVRSDGNYLEIIINDSKKHLIRSTFNDFMACLPSDKFQRTHKSYVVNIDYITGFSSNVVYVQEHEIPISKSRKDDLIRQMNLFT